MNHVQIARSSSYQAVSQDVRKGRSARRLRSALLLIVMGWLGIAAPARAIELGAKDLSASDWSGIRAAYESNRLAAVAVDGGYMARNTGQGWHTRFDGRGFLTTPNAGDWSWGLELVRFGVEGAERRNEAPICVEAAGGRVVYEWNSALTEWYINDTRGLEHGYTVQERPETGAGPLVFTLAVRGTLRPQAGHDGHGITFVNPSGAAVVNYSGLTVYDANGAAVRARFEVGDPNSQSKIQNPHFITIVVDDTNALYPLTIDPIAQQAYLKASNTGAGDEFGRSVAVSGDTVVVGAWAEDSNATGINGNQADNSASLAGAAYVFVRNGTTWTQQAYLKASNTGADDNFGTSVAASGDTVVVGAPQEDSSAVGINGNQTDNTASQSGAVYVFVRSGTTWTQQAYLKASNTGVFDYFGVSVAASGDTVVVGAFQEASNAIGINGNQADNSAADSGAAYVFVRSGTTWTQQAYLKASNTNANDQFGWSVAASGDTVVVGANGEDSNATGVNGNQADNSANFAGAAYVFVRSGTTWSQQAYLKASNTDPGDFFGFSVAASGDTVVVGAYLEASNAIGINGNQADNSLSNAGAAYVFVRSSGVWTQQAYFKASNTNAGDDFGYSVSASGDTVVVGAYLEASNAMGVNGNQTDNSANFAGAAYVFLRSAGVWSQQGYLKASNTGASDFFGFSVAVSGDTVVVGARTEASNATGVNGNQADNSAAGSGAAYVFVGVCLLDTDGDGVVDCDDVCPNNALGMAVDCNGRPLRDCNGDCLYNAADIQCLVDELFGQ
jgi:hypothetical protein